MHLRGQGDPFLVLGLLTAIGLVERWGRIRLQLAGLAVMTVGPVIRAAAAALPGVGDQRLGLFFLGSGVCSQPAHRSP